MNAARARQSSPLAAPHLEAQAGQASRSLYGPAWQRPHLAPVAAPAPATAHDASGGRPLAPADRAFFESRLGHDFGRVRIHDDSAAAESAREQQARAFTVGDQIYFAQGQNRPDSESGRELMAHELAHTVQQRNAQDVQRDHEKGTPPKKEQNLGATPPDEKVDHASGKGGEEEHFLFRTNHADLPADAVKKLQTLIANHKGTLTVKIHGYASEEGGEDVNFNLGAYRAIAVEAAIRPLLPPGATIELYTHGASKFFGPRDQNRRAGVEIVEAAPGAQAEAKPDKPLLFDPTRRYTLGGGLLPPVSRPGPYLTPPSFGTLPSPLQPTVPIDMYAMRAPFTDRGIRLTDRDFTSIQDNWNYSVLFLMKNFGLSADQAAKTTNALLPIGYDKVLSRESPNQADKLQQDMEAQEKLRGGWHTPNVPVLSIIQFLSGDKFKPEF